MTTAQDAIRARRKLTNKLIAAHDAARLKPFFLPEMVLIPGQGGILMGRDAVLEAFAAQFADPDFVTYVRTTEEVRLDFEAARAAEFGTWEAVWKSTRMSGTYLAVWRRSVGQWALESELFVTLA
jgi:ketosteroid isomerase-like protein